MSYQRREAKLSLQMIPWPEQEARNLENAARLLRQRGWCQGRFEDQSGRVCATRAYELACERQGYGLVALQIVLDTNLPIPDWNDASGRTRSDVVETMMTTARELRRVAAGNHRD